MRRLRACRQTCPARSRAPAPRRLGRRRSHARITRQVEIVVRGQHKERLAVDHRCRSSWRVRHLAPPSQPRRLHSGKLVGKNVHAGGTRSRASNMTHVQRRHILNHYRLLFQEANRLRHLLTRTAIEEDAPTRRIALLLDHGDALVSDSARRDVPGHVVRIVRYAYLGDNARRMLHLGGEHDRLRVVVLVGGRPLGDRVGGIHACGTHAACTVWL